MRFLPPLALLAAAPASAHQETLVHAHPHGSEAVIAIGLALAALAWLLWTAAR